VQVFRKREYDIFNAGCGDRIISAYMRILETGQVPIIIDAGANVGAAAIWFSKLFPASLVLAVEPDAGNAELCRLNTRHLRNIRVIEAAIGSEDGRVSLTNHQSKEQWSIRTTRSDNGDVGICPISTLMLEPPNTSKLFLIKIDIEGFESDLFAKNTHWIDETDVIIIEPHDRFYKGSSWNFQQEIARRRFDMFISGENLIYVKSAAS
jgi:FkbM family methyltransferase